jgi:hypothetical protein
MVQVSPDRKLDQRRRIDGPKISILLLKLREPAAFFAPLSAPAGGWPSASDVTGTTRPVRAAVRYPFI